MTMAAARAFQVTLKPHVPLIKFRKGTVVTKDSHVQPSPDLKPATSNVSFNQRVVTSITEDTIPAKYSRKPLTDVEIQYIMRGGPE
ncbi:hypothetical protein CHUAL_004195 [Chamberlinius hualienensis]